MAAAACGFLMREGPVTPQDRWEEAAGFSPSTLAINIAGLICAAELLAADGDHETAEFIREYADFLESHVEAWTVTTQGTLHAEVARHYIRVNPNANGQEDPNAGTLILNNQPPGGRFEYPAKDIVDAGFLELVRYGVRDAQDPIIVDSLRVVDAVLKVDLPQGPAWRRYNHDGYGQRADGSSFKGWGIGRPWPLLTGERAHYELAAGRDARPYLDALQAFAVGIGLLSEQVWDQRAIPEKLLAPGVPTGAAIPLAWAHAEYIKLVRSVADQRVFDMIEPVSRRYSTGATSDRVPMETWSQKRPVSSIGKGSRLRVIAGAPFTLRWSATDWQDQHEAVAHATRLDVWFVDIPPPSSTLRLKLLLGENAAEAIDAIVNVVTSG
jgi:glucoamylase